MVDLPNMLGRALGQAVNSVVQGVVRPDPRAPSTAGGQFGRASSPQGYAAPQGNLAEQVAKLPETFDLGKSRSLSSLVEHSLAALGFMDKRKADGNLDGASMEGMNKFRAQYQQPPLTSFEEFGKGDVGQLLNDLSQKPNADKNRVLSQAGPMLQKGLGELPQQGGSIFSGYGTASPEAGPKIEP
ncbi:MAG: hypothetical protein KBC88_04315 [Alphaproteobacteria bacterium]|jgi:hypothetical protein|nr:hypothetical protein [Alphaproteobacteria bacterium]